VSIELKVGEIEPPSVVMDIADLPDPVYLGFTITAYNYDDVGLYFQVTGSGTVWTFSTVNLGLIGSGASLRRNLDNFCYRSKPSAETQESIRLILKAYTDSGYTDLKWTVERTLDVWWIDHGDGSWTIDYLHNFDDGLTHGWNLTATPTWTLSLAVDTAYVLSPPYSLLAQQRIYTTDYTQAPSYWYGANYAELYNTFNTPDRNYVFAILNLRLVGVTVNTDIWYKTLQIQVGGVTYVYLGRTPVDTEEHFIPVGRWITIVVPLPSNQVGLELKIRWDIRPHQVADGYPNGYNRLYLDDFRIISKD